MGLFCINVEQRPFSLHLQMNSWHSALISVLPGWKEQFLPADARGIFTLKESQCLSCAAGKNDLRNVILYLLWEGESNCSN